MAQFGRPTSDIAAGDWGTAPLFDKVDEVSASDADFITGTGDLPCELALGAVTAPLAGTVTIRVRYRKDDGVVDIVDLACALLEGSTVIATHDFTNIPDTWTTGSFTLSTGERDAITDWANLRLRLTRTLGTPANAVYFNGQLITYGGEIVTYGT